MFQVFLDVNRHQENYIEDINSILYGNKYRKNNLRYGSSLKAWLFNKKRNKQTKNNQK